MHCLYYCPFCDVAGKAVPTCIFTDFSVLSISSKNCLATRGLPAALKYRHFWEKSFCINLKQIHPYWSVLTVLSTFVLVSSRLLFFESSAVRLSAIGHSAALLQVGATMC